MKKILLINPAFDAGLTTINDLIGSANKKSAKPPAWFPKANMMPVSLTTVSALTPDDVEVDIWDEGVHGTVSDSTEFKQDYDLVGVTGYLNHLGRAKEIGRTFRKRGIPVAVGGPGVSSAPEQYRDHFDILFIGEAEYTWPRFIADWKAGSYRPEYRQVAKVDMAHSPQPRWDKVAADIKDYVLGAVQTTRGCPFDCEFCDVIYIYGRQARHKAVDQVLEEVSTLERLGAKLIFFCDDNFIGNPRYAKALLKELVTLNRSFRRPVGFITQLTLNVAKDDELLELLADANFVEVFIGIETTNIESLIETNKPQNYKTDILADVKKVQSYGLPVQAGMIVGFDHDDATIFDRQFEFLQEAGIGVPLLNILKAPYGTKLWVRLHRENRILETPASRYTPDIFPMTNIAPKQMTRVELMSGYLGLVQRVRDWRNFETRVKTMLSQVRRRPKVKRVWSLKETLRGIGFVLFSMDREARWPTIRALLYTCRRAPFMMDNVSWLITHQYAQAAQAPYVQEYIAEEIRLETADGVKPHHEQTVFFIPDAFKKPYKALFPELYERVYQGLADKSRVHDALVEVVYDFLTRWGLSFQQFEEHHRTFLHEICDRTIAKENGNLQAGAGDGVGAGERPHEMAGLTQGQVAIKLSWLADEVLRSVEQDLWSFRTQTLEPELDPAVTG